MTKAAELKVLDDAIAKLGPDSYLGPWLTSVRAEVASLITSDFAPTMLPSEAYREGATLLATATAMSKKVTEDAQLKAANLLDDVAGRIAAVKQRARKQLEDLAREVR